MVKKFNLNYFENQIFMIMKILKRILFFTISLFIVFGIYLEFGGIIF
jgi:hypothetical protein